MEGLSRKRNITFMPIIVGIGIVIGAYGKFKKERKKAEKMGEHVPYGVYETVIKRPLDIVLAGTAFIVFSPLMAGIALLVKIKLGSPVLFTQKRPGLHGKVFTIFKFRTMNDKKNSKGELLSDEERLTPFGKMLRSTSLDELPELYNILSGDMSIVGPRPLLVEYLPRYNETQARRHEVRPGLTGLAQVSGRNGLSWDEKFQDDLKYVEHITFINDLCIVAKTIFTVLKREGINAGEKITMPEFMGNCYWNRDGE